MAWLCKDCWIAHDPSTLLASCRVCDANTGVQRLDPLESKTLAAELVCRFHREPLNIFCDQCRHQLSTRAIADGRNVLALLGDTGSGKTTLLWVLSERLRENGLPIKIRQSFGDTDEQMAAAVHDLFERGRTRVTAVTDAVVRNYAWELVTTDQWPVQSRIVAFHDAAGEIWNGLETLPRDDFERFYRFLDLVGGVMFMIDGERLAATVSAVADERTIPANARASEAREIAIVDNIVRRMQGREIPAAVVLSKSDVLWDRPECAAFRADSGASREDVERAVRELMAKAGRRALASALEESFASVQYFAVSAFGFATAEGEPVQREDIRPARVEEPLLALFGSEVGQTHA